MSPTLTPRQIVRFVSDATGRTPEEVWVLGTVAATVIVSVATARAVIWAVDLVKDVDVRRPVPPRTASGSTPRPRS